MKPTVQSALDNRARARLISAEFPFQARGKCSAGTEVTGISHSRFLLLVRQQCRLPSRSHPRRPAHSQCAVWPPALMTPSPGLLTWIGQVAANTGVSGGGRLPGLALHKGGCNAYLLRVEGAVRARSAHVVRARHRP
jgi:hypothetical protein